jgi:hypothetical protein
MAKSSPLWAIIIAHGCSNWGEHTLLTSLPDYMKNVLKFDIKSVSIYYYILYRTYKLQIMYLHYIFGLAESILS